MMTFMEVYERAIKGPIMSEKDFDMKVFIPRLRTVVKTYGIQYERETPVPSDDRASDHLFQAAVEFLSQVGVYCQNTNRVIQFTRKEIMDAVGEAQGRCFAGEGKEAGVFGMRRPDEKKVPWLHVGSGIVTTTEEMATNKIEGYARLQRSIRLASQPSTALEEFQC